jgi:SAM-dependent methyltransferase
MPAEHYSDQAEDSLLRLFSQANSEEERLKILTSKPSWPMYYHLSLYRSNLFSWYQFERGATLLEVGAGPGAITEELVRHNVHVTALELTLKRSTINAHRNKHAENLEIVVDNLQNYKTKKKFDYVVCVGVLEYAGRFITSDTPYESLMKLMYDNLKPGGTLLLAIENRFGLKYWAGATEDHLHQYFAGQNGYPDPKGVQTFGRQELVNLFETTGFKNPYFFYPFPDYKNPLFIYSDDFHPGHGAEFPVRFLPTPSPDYHREHFFSEQSAMRYIQKNGLFPHFSNSFLVEARK